MCPAMTAPRTAVTAFDAMADAAARQLLRPACASTAWADAMVAARPLRTLDAVTARSSRVIAALDWPDVEEALSAHPRIGERAAGANREAGWSRQEQAGAAGADDAVTAALTAGNLAYERRFGHVFLICATGRSAEEMLAALTARLDHDPAAEQRVVRRELAAIVRLRLAKTLI